jgi:uncharacterized protein YjcR
MSTEVFTTAEVAAKLGVSVNTVSKWRRAGWIAGFPKWRRAGGPNDQDASRGWRFPASEVEGLIERLTNNSNAPQ